MSELRREVSMSPAFDRRDSDPSKNYGIRCVDLRMYLIGDKGAVQFVCFTDWHLPEVAEELHAKFPSHRRGPMGADLGYHSKTPLYEDQSSRDDCNLLGCKCYYDGSGLAADRIMEVLLREGSDGVWRELETYYRETFDE